MIARSRRIDYIYSLCVSWHPTLNMCMHVRGFFQDLDDNVGGSNPPEFQPSHRTVLYLVAFASFRGFASCELLLRYPSFCRGGVYSPSVSLSSLLHRPCELRLDWFHLLAFLPQWAQRKT